MESGKSLGFLGGYGFGDGGGDYTHYIIFFFFPSKLYFNNGKYDGTIFHWTLGSLGRSAIFHKVGDF